VIGRDHRVELPPHRPHEDRVRRERPRNSAGAGGGSEYLLVFAAKPAPIAAVRIEGAESDSRLGDSEQIPQRGKGDRCRPHDHFGIELLWNFPEREMRRRQDDAQPIRGKHHCDRRPRQRAQHLGVPGVVVPSRMERRLVDRGGDDPIDAAGHRELDRPLDRETAQPSRLSSAFPSHPAADGLRHRKTLNLRTDHHDVTTLADSGVGERFRDDLRTNSAGISHGHGEARLHAAYNRSDT